MMNPTGELGQTAGAVESALADLQANDAIARLWAKDASLWKTDPAHTKIIGNSLGWLTVPATVRAHAEELARFADEIEAEGFAHIVLMGMGGSSLCTEVLRRTHIPMAGLPEMIVLDSTVPATIRRVEASIDPARTLFIVASKSGTTLEPSVFYAYFFDLVRKIKGDKAGENFIAITDPGTRMEEQARGDGFRRIFLNPPDIGGRYSALSYFGMVPAALMGLDIAALLDRVETVVESCRPETPAGQNLGLQLGAALGGAALAGRDKVTLITPSPLEAVGLWIEQLVAESTGKEGKGILPVTGEPLGSPADYGNDRLFVQVCVGDHPAPEAMLTPLVEAGHPLVTHVLADSMDLGAEFFRWEVGVALAGRLLGIDPFDQPNVQESKDNTGALLKQREEQGSLPEQHKVAEHDGLTLYADPAYVGRLGLSAGASGSEAFAGALKAHFGLVGPGDYVALTQYFDEQDDRDRLIQGIRTGIRDTLKVATTTGYGPRFLHSTGQLHKGGPDTGVFLQMTADDGEDLAIPGRPFGFAALVAAQALGDFQSLTSRNRRALRVHLGSDVVRGLRTLAEAIGRAIAGM